MHQVIEPGGTGAAETALGCAFGEEGLRDDLRDNGSDLPGRCADAMACTSISGWEAFAGNDEGCCIRSEIEEKLR